MLPASVKMASMKEKVQCVLWYHETKSPVTVQRKFRNEYGQHLPVVKSIKTWYSKFVETGNVGWVTFREKRCLYSTYSSFLVIKVCNQEKTLCSLCRLGVLTTLPLDQILTVQGGARGSGWGTALQTGRSRDRFPTASLEFFIDIILPAALWSWGRLSL
jgi:hypothetical protein